MLLKKYLLISTLSVFTLFSLAQTANARSRLEPVYIPEPVEYSKLSNAQVKKRIKKAVFKRRWQHKQVGKNRIRATYSKTGKKGTLMASINIKYGGGKIRFSYHDSEGFSYNPETKEIKRKFNGWVRNLERTMRVEFGDY